MSQAPLKATYTGFVYSTWDALILFEACLSGRLNHVARRPHDRERSELIKSGNVFIYEENASGIKRWTDGVPWSPSRILGNFLVYRELERAFPPGEKKKALKKQKKTNPSGVAKPEARSPSSSIDHIAAASLAASSAVGTAGSSPMASGTLQLDEKDSDRYLIGSLIDSYPFKEKGLVKKTISISYRGVPHHLVSYYSVEDARQLRTPSNDHSLGIYNIRPELVGQQTFRVALEQDETSFPNAAQHAHNAQHGPPPPGAMMLAGMHPHMQHMGLSIPAPMPPMQAEIQRRVPMASSHMAGVAQGHHNLDLVQSYPGQPWPQTHPYDEGIPQPQTPMGSFASHQFGDAAAGRPPHYAGRGASLPYGGEGDSRGMAMAALNMGAYPASVGHEAHDGGRALDPLASSSVGAGAGPDYSHQPVARTLGIENQFHGQTGAGDLGPVVHAPPAHRQYQVDDGACMPFDGANRAMYSRVPGWPQDSGPGASRQTQDQGGGLDGEYHLPPRR